MATVRSGLASAASTLVPVTRPRLLRLLAIVADRLPGPARLLLVGDSALVAAGLLEWTDHVVYAVDAADPVEVDRAMREAAAVEGTPVEHESPADVLPLPGGFEGRARSLGSEEGAASSPGLAVLAFDPVSVAVRLVARGNEPDYRTVLAFLRHGWVTMAALESALPSSSARRVP